MEWNEHTIEKSASTHTCIWPSRRRNIASKCRRTLHSNFATMHIVGTPSQKRTHTHTPYVRRAYIPTLQLPHSFVRSFVRFFVKRKLKKTNIYLNFYSFFFAHILSSSASSSSLFPFPFPFLLFS